MGICKRGHILRILRSLHAVLAVKPMDLTGGPVPFKKDNKEIGERSLLQSSLSCLLEHITDVQKRIYSVYATDSNPDNDTRGCSNFKSTGMSTTETSNAKFESLSNFAQAFKHIVQAIASDVSKAEAPVVVDIGAHEIRILDMAFHLLKTLPGEQ